VNFVHLVSELCPPRGRSVNGCSVLAGAVGVAVEGEDGGVMDEAVDGGGATMSSPRVWPHWLKARFLVTMTEGEVPGDDD